MSVTDSAVNGTANGAATAAAASSFDVAINVKSFWSRSVSLYESWRGGGRLWGAQQPQPTSAPVDSIMIITETANEANDADTYSRLSAVQIWLFGYEIPESAILFTQTPDQITILTSTKKARILSPLKEQSGSLTGGIRLQIIESNKVDRNAENISILQRLMNKSKLGKRVGHIPHKSAPAEKSLAAILLKSLTTSLELFDINSGIGSCLSIHDSAARACLTTAGDLSTRVMKKYLISELETIIDEEKEQQQLALADLTEEVIRTPAKVGLTNLVMEDCDSCYTPIIQSGGEGEGAEYDLRPSAQTSTLPLHYDPQTAIIIQLGARYRNYCSNIGRTYFVDPHPQQKKVYQILIQVYLACKSVMKPGNKIQQIMLSAKRVISQSEYPELLEKFTKNCGFGIGLEFRDPSLLITDKNGRTIVKGMCFNLTIGFSDLSVTESGKKYAVYLSDTFLIKEEEAESLTKMPREYKDISYFIKDAEMTDATAPISADVPNGTINALEGVEFGVRTTRHANQKDVEEATAADKIRAAHQAELARKQRERALKLLAAENAEGQFNAGLNSDQSAFHAYNSPTSFPAQAKKDRIYVDVVAEALLLPIHDQLVPFHINTVKNVHRQEEGPYTSLRITFYTPDGKNNPINPNQSSSSSSNNPLRYISELTYRTASDALDKVFYDIKELRKRIQNRIKELEAKSSLVVQENLILSTTPNPPILKDVSARPQLSRKRTTGTLTAHQNGFRYLTTDKFKVDLIYGNIKSCFYQPAEGTHQVLLHFELKNPILLDKTKMKKTHFLQIYYEVVDVSEDLSSTNRYRDEDGLMEEQEERIRRKRWNEKFLSFVKDVEQRLATHKDLSHRLEFDIPYRELAFTGVPAKSTVEIMPTVHSLVALDDQPPLVLPLSEVEISVFERVQFGLKNFDLVFVYKDFSRLPMRIDSIPMKFLEPIKHWLNSCDIVFYESNQNLLWKAVMKEVNADIEEFWKTGGWASFLSDEADVEGGGGGEEGDEDAALVEESGSEFELSEEEASDEDSEEYETPSDEDEEGEDDEMDGEDDLESDEEGEDWDTLESKAKRQDRERKDKQKQRGERDFSDEDDDDDEQQQRPKKKSKP